MFRCMNWKSGPRVLVYMWWEAVTVRCCRGSWNFLFFFSFYQLFLIISFFTTFKSGETFFIPAFLFLRSQKKQVHSDAADWHSALLKLSVRRKIMCIPLIYISCVKILRMYSVKNSLMLMVIGWFHILCGLTGQQHCILTAWRDRKRLFHWSAEFPRHWLRVSRKRAPLCKQLVAIHKCLTQL